MSVIELAAYEQILSATTDILMRREPELQPPNLSLEQASLAEFALPGVGGAQHGRVVASPANQHHADRQTI